MRWFSFEIKFTEFNDCNQILSSHHTGESLVGM